MEPGIIIPNGTGFNLGSRLGGYFYDNSNINKNPLPVIRGGVTTIFMTIYMMNKATSGIHSLPYRNLNILGISKTYLGLDLLE